MVVQPVVPHYVVQELLHVFSVTPADAKFVFAQGLWRGRLRSQLGAVKHEARSYIKTCSPGQKVCYPRRG